MESPLDLTEELEEERLPGYDAKLYYPMRIGDLLQDKYKVLFKLGYGTSSTVWLAQDVQTSQYAALKVCISKSKRNGSHHETDLLRHIALVKPSDPGLAYIRLLQDSFELEGPYGPHPCLVFEPLRESAEMFFERLNTIPSNLYAIMRYYMKFMLLALRYLHTECHVIHTDLKLTNIMLGFEPGFQLDDVVATEHQSPSLRKELADRIIYVSKTDFGPLSKPPGRPKISDFSAAVHVDKVDIPLTFPIQPDYYRAPEVTMGASWSYSADVWNLGLLLWDMAEEEVLFDGVDEQGEWSPFTQIAQIAVLVGPPPRELVARGDYGSLFFNEDGSLTEECASKEILSRSWEDTITVIDGPHKQEWIRFARRMLQWLPEERPTVEELLRDPFVAELGMK